MQQIYFLSGPCGIGKSTAAEALAHRLLSYDRAVCLIHGDDLGDCLHLPEEFSPFTEDGHIRDAALWNRILQFNWQSLLDMAANARLPGSDYADAVHIHRYDVRQPADSACAAGVYRCGGW